MDSRGCVPARPMTRKLIVTAALKRVLDDLIFTAFMLAACVYILFSNRGLSNWSQGATFEHLSGMASLRITVHMSLSFSHTEV